MVVKSATLRNGKLIQEDALVGKLVRKRLSSLKLCHENERIYGDLSQDPEIYVLSEKIRNEGLLDPLVISEDNYIFSGYKRRLALMILGQEWVPCRRIPKRRSLMTSEECIALLREYNRYRDKTVQQQLHEELIDLNPDA
jgi:hypothetical protein